MRPDLGRDLVLHFYFLELANSRPVTLILGFNPERVVGAETSNQKWICGPECRVYLSVRAMAPSSGRRDGAAAVRSACAYLRRLSFSSRALSLSEFALLR